jgi:hypothetical protein
MLQANSGFVGVCALLALLVGLWMTARNTPV